MKSELQIVVYTGAESVVYEARVGGRSVAAKKPRLSTTNDMDRFHTELQILRSVFQLSFLLIIMLILHILDKWPMFSPRANETILR
jgi:hypothetical protein